MNNYIAQNHIVDIFFIFATIPDNPDVSYTGTERHFIMRVDSTPIDPLTNWGQDKLAAISQMVFSNAFSWMKYMNFN